MTGLLSRRPDDAPRLPFFTTEGSPREAGRPTPSAAFITVCEAGTVIWLGVFCLAALFGYLFYALIKPERF